MIRRFGLTTLAALALSAPACAYSVVSAPVIPLAPPIPVYAGCPAAFINPTPINTPGVQATNHVWYFSPSGQNDNDGTSVATAWLAPRGLFVSGQGNVGHTNAHPLLNVVDNVNGVVHAGDQIFLETGNYGSVSLGTGTEYANGAGTPILFAADAGQVPTFTGFTLNAVSDWIIRGLKVAGANSNATTFSITGNSGSTPAADLTLVGNDISSVAGGIGQYVSSWDGTTSTYTPGGSGSGVLTVSAMLPASAPITTGMIANWDNGGNFPGPATATIGTQISGTPGGAGSYNVTDPTNALVAWPNAGNAAPFIMSAIDPTFSPNIAQNALRITGSGTQSAPCLSVYANKIHDAFFAASFSSFNSLFEGNEIYNWYKSAFTGFYPNTSFISNYFHDTLSTQTNHPDVLQIIFPSDGSLISMANLSVVGNIYNEHVDPSVVFSGGSFFIIGGSKYQGTYDNLTIVNNQCITSLFDCIQLGTVHTGLVASNTFVSPDALAAYNPTLVKADIQFADASYPVSNSFFTSSGNLETFILTSSLGGIGIPNGLGLVAQNFTPSAYNGNWTVSGLVPFTFTGTISGTTLTTSASTGTLGPNEIITGTGVAANTKIVSGSGSSWVVNNSQTVGPITMTVSNAVTATNPSVVSDPGPITVFGQFGMQTTNLVIRDNLATNITLSNQWSPVGAGGLTMDHNTTAACVGTGCVASNIQWTLTGNPPTQVTCTTSPCNDPSGNPTLNVLTAGSLVGTGVWQAWNPSTLNFALWPLVTATAVAGQGASWDALYSPTTDYRGIPWTNPPTLGSSRCFSALVNAC